jgi:hypothetical protein
MIASALAHTVGGMSMPSALGGLEVDQEFKYRQLQDWKLGGSLALEDAADVEAGPPL